MSHALVKRGLNSFINDKILDCSNLTLFQRTNFSLLSIKLKEFQNNNFKSDENGINFVKRVEKTMRKGEIAR